MRIEIDDSLEKTLDAIKEKHSNLTANRGHAETVRFLADYYKNHKALDQLLLEIKMASAGFISDLDGQIRTSLERALPKAFANVITGLLTYAPRQEKAPDPQGTPDQNVP